MKPAPKRPIADPAQALAIADYKSSKLADDERPLKRIRVRNTPVSFMVYSDTGLTPRQERFAEEYLKDCNCRQAARRAGYSDRVARNRAYLFIKHPIILQHIQRLRDERRKRTALEADAVLDRLLKVANQAELDGDSTTNLRAIELMGKHLGLWVDRTEVHHSSPLFHTRPTPEDYERLVRVARANGIPHPMSIADAKADPREITRRSLPPPAIIDVTPDPQPTAAPTQSPHNDEESI